MSACPITVIIPLYNKEYFIKRCLESVLHQSIIPNEVIVIDDGSSDDSLRIVKDNFGTNNLIRIVEKPNEGVAATRNFGMNLAETEYVAFLDADDQLAPKYIEALLDAINDFRDIDVFSTGHIIKYYRSGAVIQEIEKVVSGFKSPSVVKDYFKNARQISLINSSKVCLRRSALQSVGGFPVGALVGEDIYTWAMLMIHYKLVYIPKALVVVNYITDDSRAARTGNVLYLIKMIHKVVLLSKESSKKTKGLAGYIRIVHFKHLVSLLIGGYKETAIEQTSYLVRQFPFTAGFSFILILLPTIFFKALQGKGRL